MIRPISVQAISDHELEVIFPDGTQGRIDLQADIGQGVFAPLADPTFFASVHLAPNGAIRWNTQIEICPDAVYWELTGRLPAEPTHA